MDRRQFIGTTATAIALSPLSTLAKTPVVQKESKRMGISIASYAYRWNHKEQSKEYPAFTDALQVLKHSEKLGAGGVQIGVRGWAAEFAGKVRDTREKMGLYLEGQISLPRKPEEADRFSREVKYAKEAGASILRCVCLGGRRYETFKSLDAFQAFRKESIEALERAEPIMRQHKVKLARENHKDWRIQGLIDILDHLGSEWMGVTLDTGNNISLLEDPMAVVAKLAPYTFTTHFKDMGVASYEDGFLLAEVPLGAGILDLNKVVEICQTHNPDVTFNLEMITRDPLKIPCMTDQYWETFNTVSGKDLASTLRMVEQHGQQLPTVSEKTSEERLAFEELNVRDSFRYAVDNLGLK